MKIKNAICFSLAVLLMGAGSVSATCEQDKATLAESSATVKEYLLRWKEVKKKEPKKAELANKAYQHVLATYNSQLATFQSKYKNGCENTVKAPLRTVHGGNLPGAQRPY